LCLWAEAYHPVLVGGASIGHQARVVHAKGGQRTARQAYPLLAAGESSVNGTPSSAAPGSTSSGDAAAPGMTAPDFSARLAAFGSAKFKSLRDGQQLALAAYAAGHRPAANRRSADTSALRQHGLSTATRLSSMSRAGARLAG
jgi:hypothetical protein